MPDVTVPHRCKSNIKNFILDLIRNLNKRNFQYLEYKKATGIISASVKKILSFIGEIPEV